MPKSDRDRGARAPCVTHRGRGSRTHDAALAVGILAALCISATGARQAGAADIELFPGGDFEAAVEALNPGDVLTVHEGRYDTTGRISISVSGTASSPVLVRAAPGESPPLITRPAGAAVQNTINIEGASHLTLRGLEITGNGGDAVNLSGNPSHITLEALHIHDVDVGVNLRSSMDNIFVRRNHIHDTGADGGTGEGMYIGCNYANCVVRDSVFEANWIHDTLNSSQGDGIEIKRGSHSNVVRDNIIYNTNYPCILLYGTEGGSRNLVEGNALWDCGDSAIQVAADAVIRNNLLINDGNQGLTSQPHQGVTPNNLEFVHNTVVVSGATCLRLNNWGGKSGMVFSNNAVYCSGGDFRVDDLSAVQAAGNVFLPAPPRFSTSAYTLGNSLGADFAAPANRDYYPRAGSTLIDAGSAAFAVSADYNGTARSGTPDAGAYTRTASANPGGAVVPGFKSASPPAAIDAPTNLRVD